MKKINVLTNEMANKISAGEVVERPASVIKELVENSVDAGADSIIVEIKNGGISYIRVTDNGCGISPEDIKTAFLPHATSKIFDENDLYSIKTLGFRGEALASIAAVSKVEIMSKTPDEDGTHLVLEGGKIISEETVGCPVGTTIVVKNLFFNTPARMKFLKKDSTEASYITDIVERLVMANPNISVRYIIDEKERLFVGGDGNLKSCIYAVYGRDYANGCLEITNKNPSVKISGYAGNRETSRGNRAFQSIFVNGRYVRNRAVTAAAENAYKNILMTGRFPFFAICIEVPFETVDINVHPTKLEVKFANERAVCDEVYWSVRGALERDADKIREQIKQPAAASVFERAVVTEAPKPEQTFIHIKNTAAVAERPVFESVPAAPKPAVTEEKVEKTVDFFKLSEPPKVELRSEPAVPGYKIIGQLFDTYIVLELENEILLMDQHAAHERMIYQKLVRMNNEKQTLCQPMLSPIALTLSPDEYEAAFEKSDELEKYGFEIEDFGSGTVLVRRVPADLAEEDVKSVILEIINNSSADYMEENIHTIACKAAIKANKKLSDREIDELVSLFVREGGVNTCPHGRPIVIKISKYELEKMFKRIV